jgi:hypothetical protein
MQSQAHVEGNLFHKKNELDDAHALLQALNTAWDATILASIPVRTDLLSLWMR